MHPFAKPPNLPHWCGRRASAMNQYIALHSQNSYWAPSPRIQQSSMVLGRWRSRLETSNSRNAGQCWSLFYKLAAFGRNHRILVYPTLSQNRQPEVPVKFTQPPTWKSQNPTQLDHKIFHGRFKFVTTSLLLLLLLLLHHSSTCGCRHLLLA